MMEGIKSLGGEADTPPRCTTPSAISSPQCFTIKSANSDHPGLVRK